MVAKNKQKQKSIYVQCCHWLLVSQCKNYDITNAASYCCEKKKSWRKNGETKKERTINLCSSHMYQQCSDAPSMLSHFLCLKLPPVP